MFRTEPLDKNNPDDVKAAAAYNRLLELIPLETLLRLNDDAKTNAERVLRYIQTEALHLMDQLYDVNGPKI